MNVPKKNITKTGELYNHFKYLRSLNAIFKKKTTEKKDGTIGVYIYLQTPGGGNFEQKSKPFFEAPRPLRAHRCDPNISPGARWILEKAGIDGTRATNSFNGILATPPKTTPTNNN